MGYRTRWQSDIKSAMRLAYRLSAGSVLFPVAIVLPTLAIYAPLATAPLIVVVALAMVAVDWRRSLAGLRHTWPLAALLGALGIWGLLSSLWSVAPRHSGIEALRFLAISGAGLAILAGAMSVSPRERSLIGHGLIVGLIIALGLAAAERAAGAPLMHFLHPIPPQAEGDLGLMYYRFDRGLVVLALLVWVSLIADTPLWLRLGILLAAAVLSTFMVTEAAELAMAGGVFVFAVGRFFPRAAAILMVSGLLAISIVIPLATPGYGEIAHLHTAYPGIKWSGIHRLLIWRFGADHVAERPVLGWGMDAARAMPGGKTDLTTLLPPAHYPAQAQAMPLHPHNATLQLLLELGPLGLALGLAVAFWIIARVSWQAQLSIERRAAGLALIASGLTIGLLSFGVWQEWWQATLWLAASLFAAQATDAV